MGLKGAEGLGFWVSGLIKGGLKLRVVWGFRSRTPECVDIKILTRVFDQVSTGLTSCFFGYRGLATRKGVMGLELVVLPDVGLQGWI